MNKVVGFIGCGNMAQCMIGGLAKSNLIENSNIIASNPSKPKLNFVSENYGIQTTTDNKEVASKSDMLILSVKPNIYTEVIKEITDIVNDEIIIATIAAGKNIEFVEKEFGRKVKIIRTMPNVTSTVKEGVTAVCYNDMMTEADLDWSLKVLKSFGIVEIIDEKIMDTMPAISGSSPAYVFMFIEAMVEGGVSIGIPREQAQRMAAQSVLGAAKMVLESDKSCSDLKDMVCSPKGCTIEALKDLEKHKFADAVISAMKTCTDKAIKMSK